MPATEVNRYETWELDAMVESVDPMFSFLLDTFFPGERQFDGTMIEFDVVEHGRRIAPFVSPMVPGQPTRRPGFRTFQLKPAYLKMSFKVTPGDGFTRRPGEAYGGTMSVKERLDRAMAEQIIVHDEMITNRLEWMAASALINGAITISGPDYPAVTVNFGRDPNLAMTVGNAWGGGSATPLADIQTMALRINASSRGANADTVVMTGAAFDNAVKATAFKDLLNTQYNQSPGTSGFELGPRNTRAASYQGRLAGRFDVWTYDGYYEDDTGVATSFMTADKVIVAARGQVEGSKIFGAIQDLDNGIRPQRHFAKSRSVWDPSAEELLSQSAPVVNMRRPNTVGVLDVTP